VGHHLAQFSTLLMPGLLGLLVGVLAPKGVALGGLAVGVVVAYQLAFVAGGLPSEPLAAALSVGASGVGFAIGWGIRQPQVAYTPPQRLSPADRTRLETDLNGQLRQIDPTAPGAFEQASVLLRQVNEQLSVYGPWGPWPVSDKGLHESPTELLRIQAEVLEATRHSAIAAGASRVTVTATRRLEDVFLLSLSQVS
jgi:hypothetical protein